MQDKKCVSSLRGGEADVAIQGFAPSIANWIATARYASR